MPLKLPDFAAGDGYDARDEYSDFLSASDPEGAHHLAELAHIQTYRRIDDVKAKKDDLLRSGLYRRIARGWAAFYSIGSLPIRVAILVAGDLAVHSEEKLEAEAKRRLAELPP